MPGRPHGRDRAAAGGSSSSAIMTKFFVSVTKSFVTQIVPHPFEHPRLRSPSHSHDAPLSSRDRLDDGGPQKPDELVEGSLPPAGIRDLLAVRRPHRIASRALGPRLQVAELVHNRRM